MSMIDRYQTLSLVSIHRSHAQLWQNEYIYICLCFHEGTVKYALLLYTLQEKEVNLMPDPCPEPSGFLL